MNVRDELRVRARKSTIAAGNRVDREAVIAILKRYDATRVSHVADAALPDFIDEIEALESKKFASLEVQFLLGEEVTTIFRPQERGIVVGYEVRYIVNFGSIVPPRYGHPAKRLKRHSGVKP